MKNVAPVYSNSTSAISLKMYTFRENNWFLTNGTDLRFEDKMIACMLGPKLNYV